MKVICVWKVSATLTGIFKKKMREEKNLHQDSPATLLNTLADFNFWYETTESFGDVTEIGAENICKSYSVPMREFALCMKNF